MMTKEALFFLAGAGLALASMPAPALAQPMSGDWHHHGMAMLAGLHLTPDQKTSLHQAFDSQKATMHALFREDEALHRQMRDGLFSGASGATLSALMQKDEAVHAKMDAEHLQMMLQLRSVLTPAQLAEAKATMAKMDSLHAQERALWHGGENASTN